MALNGGPRLARGALREPEDYKDVVPSNPVFIGVSSHPLVWLLIESRNTCGSFF